MMNERKLASLGFVVLTLAACGGPPQQLRKAPELTARRMSVWVDGEDMDEGTAFRLQRVGVDQIVVRRGSVRLGSGAPVLRLVRGPALKGPIPVAVALRVEEMAAGADAAMAASMWGGLVGELGGLAPAEIILDMPQVPPGASAFLSGLVAASGVSVVPVVTLEQLHGGAARELAGVVQECIVPIFGTEGLDFRGVGQMVGSDLQERLNPLTRAGLKLRAGLVLRPRCEPSVGRWGDSLDALCENDVAEMSTSSVLDRTFLFRRNLRWSGRDWKAGDKVAVRWNDAARLQFFLAETSRLVMPDLVGWDLVPLPPLLSSLGMDRNALIEYLEGRGPEPEISVRVERRGSNLRLTMRNLGPFASTISNLGNWVQLSVDEGFVRVDGRGDFERVVVGSVSRGTWRSGSEATGNAARFLETYVAPHETVQSGWIRLPSSRSQVDIRWTITLSNGAEYSGSLRG